MSQSAARTEPARTSWAGSTSYWRLCATLSAGHLFKHFYQNAFFILVPEIKASLGLSDVGTGAIQSIRSVTSGVMNLPAGMMTDMWRDRVNLILATSLTLLRIYPYSGSYIRVRNLDVARPSLWDPCRGIP
ncbi:MAG: family permease/MFS family permease [Dehalococcoidia bacterium]|nr:family permease/MFS family permease [Dehalococcoidia bacterium]